MLCFELVRTLTMVWLHRRVSWRVLGCLALRDALWTLEVRRKLVLGGWDPLLMTLCDVDEDGAEGRSNISR